MPSESRTNASGITRPITATTEIGDNSPDDSASSPSSALDWFKETLLYKEFAQKPAAQTAYCFCLAAVCTTVVQSSAGALAASAIKGIPTVLCGTGAVLYCGDTIFDHCRDKTREQSSDNQEENAAVEQDGSGETITKIQPTADM